jgi:thioredoxin-like negative regulator of GroEL
MHDSKTMALPFVDERDFEGEVLRSELPVLVVFVSARSAPCKQMEPAVAALSDELAGKAKVVQVDVDRSKLLAQKLRLQSVPTVMVFDGARLVAAEVGAFSLAQLRQMIEPFLPRAEGALRPAEAAQLLAQKQIVPVDTRDPPVYARAHLPGAVNMPLAEIPTRLAELHMLPAEPLLYCRSGADTKELAAKLSAEGTPVAYLEGGILGWEAEGLPVDRPD